MTNVIFVNISKIYLYFKMAAIKSNGVEFVDCFQNYKPHVIMLAQIFNHAYEAENLFPTQMVQWLVP